MKLIKNARIITGTGDEIENGEIAFDDKIRYVGTKYSGTADEVYDMLGYVAVPGLIDSHCHVGLFGDSTGFEGADANEDSDPVTPHLRAIDGINPQDRAFCDALSSGITTVVTGPGSANPIGGQFAAIKTYGHVVDDMVLKAPCAMKMALGENPKTVYNDKNQSPITRMGTVAVIREALFKAVNYRDEWAEYRSDEEENDRPEFDMKLEALLPVVNREIPVKFHAHRADDICSAIRIAKEFNLLYSIEHCSDGDIVSDLLARESVAVNLGPTLTDRSKPELKNLSFDTYKNLSEQGIDVSIITDHPEITIENLPLCAALAVSHGMDKDKALGAITSIAAKNCMLLSRIGTIEVGKDADIAVFDRSPIEFNAKCQLTFVDGKTAYIRK
ncbi:MAG: amidohydrolase [Clostridiales bacterium]|nr:amidohydrolase [Clostridiales bacterium]